MIPELVGDFVGSLGSVAPGPALLFVGATAAFLPAPDADLWLLRLLHHRSILTHSILLPLLLWWGLPDPLALAGPLAAGAFLGVSVHLAADILSPSRGYGQVWLPGPRPRSLGRWSRLWLFVNAMAGAGLAALALPPGPGWRAVAAGAGAVAAVGYGLRNERSILAVAMALVAVGVGLGAHRGLAPY